MSHQQSSRLARTICRLCAHSPSLQLRSSTTSVTTIADRAITRHFTVSASRQKKLIRASPAARKVTSSYGKAPARLIPRETWRHDHNDMKARVEQSYLQMHSNGLAHQVLDPSITPKVLLEIGRRLVDQAFNAEPTVEALKSIWKGDPGRVYEVAFSINVTTSFASGAEHVLKWAMRATRHAGFVHTLAGEIIRQIKASGAILPTSREIELIKKIAYEKEDPVALMLYAKVARKWGRTEEAIDIYNHLADLTYPSARQPRYNEDITIGNQLDPPWKTLVELYNEAEKYDEADEMLMIGALNYKDPQALVTYAYVRKEKDDWEGYERCLVAAATSGHAEACYRLGNYYYRIHLGELPSLNQRKAAKHPVRAFISKCLTYLATEMDWRHLAVNWYEMASAHGSAEGTRNFAVLMREDGHPNAWELMNRLRMDSTWWNNKNVIKLREHWDNPKFRPKLPALWLGL